VTPLVPHVLTPPHPAPSTLQAPSPVRVGALRIAIDDG
jgi:hypothetical protein